MKILITGGAGFIGSHISKLLLDDGHEVVIFDNFSKSSKNSLDSRAALIEADLKDSERLKNALEGVEVVIHAANFIEVAESVKNPLKFSENNIDGSIALLEAMRHSGVKKIIFSSSACVYGEPDSLPLTEDAPIRPDNPYGATKVAIEAFLNVYHKLFGFDVVILRYFNPYGPGENHQPETHAIPNFVKAGLQKKPVPLYWKGEQVRDFIFIEDLAKAHVLSLNMTGFNIYNLGTERGVKVIDVINELSDIFGYRLEIEDLGERSGDVRANYASSTKFKEATGWESKVSLKEGLQKTVEWFKKLQ